MKKSIIIGLSVIAGILAYYIILAFLLTNHESFSKQESSYYYSIQRKVGLFNSIDFEKCSASNGFGEEDYVSEKIKVSKSFSRETFGLENKGFPRDEEVDNITLTKGNVSLVINRKTHFKEYEVLFLKADQILKETRARFEQRISKNLELLKDF